MAGHHSAHSSGSNWKMWIVIAALALVIVVLGFLCIHFILGEQSPEPAAATGISATIAAQDADGKNVTDKIAVSLGTMRPDTVAPEAELMLLDISWNAKRDPSMPMILTISDPGFKNDDGLAVYHYENGQWVLLGTYLIANQAVSFEVTSLSPFAFQQISAIPDPTATPEPTPSPEPTPTPAPTPEPVDYGKYNEVQEGLFVQSEGIKLDDSYIIGYVHPEELEIPEDGEVTVFGDESEDASSTKVYTATVLVNYDGENLSSVDVLVGKTNDDQYYILDPVVEGMLWTAVASDPYNGADRFSLENNEKYLNLDNENENVVMDDNDYRTRWLYEEVEVDDDTTIDTLTYRISPDSYYAEVFELVKDEADEAEAVEGEEPAEDETAEDEEEPAAKPNFTYSVTTDEEKALELVIFRLDDGTADVDTDRISGTLILMSTPEANQGLDATPIPTINPDDDDDDGGLPSVNPTPKPTTAPTTAPTKTPDTDPDPTEKPADPTEKPADPTEVPTNSNTVTPPTPPASNTNT